MDCNLKLCLQEALIISVMMRKEHFVTKKVAGILVALNRSLVKKNCPRLLETFLIPGRMQVCI